MDFFCFCHISSVCMMSPPITVCIILNMYSFDVDGFMYDTTDSHYDHHMDYGGNKWGRYDNQGRMGS